MAWQLEMLIDSLIKNNIVFRHGDVFIPGLSASHLRVNFYPHICISKTKTAGDTLGTNKRCFSVGRLRIENKWRTITVSADHIQVYYPLTCVQWKWNNKVAELWLTEFLN